MKKSELSHHDGAHVPQHARHALLKEVHHASAHTVAVGGKSDIHTSEAHHQSADKKSQHLSDLKVTDIEHQKSILVDHKRSIAERLSAARELDKDNVHKVLYAENGVQKELHIEHSRSDGRLRVLQVDKLHGDKILLEDSNHHSYTDHLSAKNLQVTHSDSHHRVHHRSVQGISYHSQHMDGVGSYKQPDGAREFHDPSVDPNFYQLRQNPDGSKVVEFKGCNVDTDGASRHREDSCWQSQTSLRLSSGESLNTDLDNFVVLSPSLARACGARLGDLGYLVDKSTGRAVPVVFGDVGPEGKTAAEASVHALKQLGRSGTIDGNHGLSGGFEVIVVPKSGNSTGDIARSPDKIKLALDNRQAHSNLDA